MSVRKLSIAFFLVAAAGFLFGFQRQARQTPGLRLSVDPAQLDIGSQWAQADFPWELAVHNDEDRPLHVLGIRSTCGCVEIRPESFTIPANSSKSIELILDLNSSENASETPETPFSATLYPRVADVSSAEVKPWRLAGRVRHAGACSPPALLLTGTNSLVQHRQPGATAVQINWFVPVENVTATSDGDRFSVQVSAVSATETLLAVTPSTPTEAEEFAENLYVTATPKGDSVPLPPLTIPIFGRAVSDLHTTPDVLDVGVLSVGEVAQSTLVLDTYSGRKPTAVEVDTSSLGDSLKVFVDDSAASASFEYTAGPPGAISESVILVARFGDGSSVAHEVRVMGYVAADRDGPIAAGRNPTKSNVAGKKSGSLATKERRL